MIGFFYDLGKEWLSITSTNPHSTVRARVHDMTYRTSMRGRRRTVINLPSIDYDLLGEAPLCSIEDWYKVVVSPLSRERWRNVSGHSVTKDNQKLFCPNSQSAEER
jgi:hypothetical protein